MTPGREPSVEYWIFFIYSFFERGRADPNLQKINPNLDNIDNHSIVGRTKGPGHTNLYKWSNLND